MSMREDQNAGPSWLKLLLKMALGLAWLGAGGVASAVLMRESSKAADAVAALFLIVPPVLWCVLAVVRAKRLDEMHQRVAFLGLANGMRFAIMWVGLMIGGSVLSSLYLGGGEVNVSGMMQNAVTFIAIQPALAFILSETTRFGQLRAYAKRG
jgi:hypothetical protein